MALLVLNIGLLQNILDLLVDVLNPLNESGIFVDHTLIRGRVCLCGGKRKCNINGSQGLESQMHLKWAMAIGTMESPVVTMLDIWKTLVPCTWMLKIVHAQDVHNYLIDDLCLAIYLGMESNGFCELRVQQRPKTRPKGAEEPVVSVKDDGLWYPKVNSHSFEEDISSIRHSEIILTSCEDGHIRKPIDNHKHTVISLLGGWKARHVIH
jgi:hypothetical protein